MELPTKVEGWESWRLCKFLLSLCVPKGAKVAWGTGGLEFIEGTGRLECIKLSLTFCRTGLAELINNLVYP